MNKSHFQPYPPQKPPTKNKNSTNKTVTAPVAKSAITKIARPVFTMPKQATDGRVCIRHSEFIGDINGSINFTANTFQINPGLPVSFPWLNTVAIAYESYRFKYLSFSFKSSKSTSTNGTVLLTMDFDPSDAAPTNKAQALAYNNAIRGPAWETFTYVASKQDLTKMNQKFIRYGALQPGQDVLLYDVGNLFVCTTGFADNTTIGELHVDFEVELFTPQFDTTAYALATAAKVSSVGAVSNAAWLGTSTTQTGGVQTSYASSALNIAVPGQYIFVYTLTGTGLAQAGVPTFSSLGNTISLVSQAVSATQIIYVLTVQIDQPQFGITVTNLTTAATTFTNSILRIGYYAVSLA